MLIFVQYPIADFRLFINEPTGKLRSPLWPSPMPDQEFIRSFGKVRKRGKGGIEGWIGENEICEARHAIKFDTPIGINLKKRINGGKLLPGMKCASRHFYFDGTAVAKFELVFVTIPTIVNISPEDFIALFRGFLSIGVEIPSLEGRRKYCTIHNAGKALAETYLKSTTRTRYLDEIDFKTWAKAGSPLFWVEFNEKEKLPLPMDASRINTTEGDKVPVYFWRATHEKNQSFNVWLVKRQDVSENTYDKLRTARIMLTRLNSEREVFWSVLNMVEKGLVCKDESDDGENSGMGYLQHYFNESTRRIFRLEKSESRFFEPDEIGIFIRRSIDEINPGRTNSLFKTLERLELRPQIDMKVRQMIMGENKTTITHVHGDQYNIGKGVLVGGKAQVENNQITVTDDMSINLNLDKLAVELNILYEELKKSPGAKKHKKDLEAIRIAEEAAKKGNASKSMKTLEKLGTWTLNIAEKIGVAVVIAAIKNSFGR